MRTIEAPPAIVRARAFPMSSSSIARSTCLRYSSPALQTLYNAFPDFDRTTVMYIYTLPSLVGIPVTILIGLIAGIKVRYRTILLSATALMVVMGTTPFFIDNLYAILACRFLFGIGQASCLGVEVSLMYMFFSGKELARYMGFTQVADSLGNIVFMQIGGILATTGWHMVFLACLIVAVAIMPRSIISTPRA